jgi:hypothetical protein
VGLALLVLGDLCARLVDIDAFYTDAGVLPRSLLRIQDFRFSFHAMTGDRRGEEALFLVAAGFALLLLFGIWSRIAAAASWLLLASLHARNPLLLNHGDELLRIFLFWSIFVPLSSDRGSSPDGASKMCCSIFTAALVVQVCAVYFFGALLKTDSSWTAKGTAIYSALSLEQFSTAFGRALLGWPLMLKVATLCVYYLELVGPLLIFVPWKNRRIREIAILSFVAVHLAIAATMKLGVFPWVSILGWVLILPSETLDMLQRVTRWRSNEHSQNAMRDHRAGPIPRMAVQVLGGYLLFSVLIWNVRGLNIRTEDVNPTPLDHVLRVTQLDQRWNMFAPKPNYVRGWYAAKADLADGSQVDLMNDGRSFSLKRPDIMAETYPDFRWRKYLINIWRERFAQYRQGLSAYLRRRWDGAHPGSMKVDRLTVFFVWQDLSAGPDSPIRTTVIAQE